MFSWQVYILVLVCINNKKKLIVISLQTNNNKFIGWRNWMKVKIMSKWRRMKACLEAKACWMKKSGWKWRWEELERVLVREEENSSTKFHHQTCLILVCLFSSWCRCPSFSVVGGFLHAPVRPRHLSFSSPTRPR